MDFNNKEFWSIIIVILLIFAGTWILAAFTKPIWIAVLITIVLITWRWKSIWVGIKHYWLLLLGKIIKK